MPVEMIPIESPFGLRVEQRFQVHEPASGRLMVILPGRGYTVNHPVLFHIADMAHAQGYDVLPVQYGFQLSGSLEPYQIPLLQEDVRLSVEPVLKRGYSEICVVGKSLGSPLALDLVQTLDADKLSLILITPVGAALQANPGVRTLAIIGTADALYAPDIVKLTEGKVTWRVLERLDHSLLAQGDWQHSLRSLEQIVLDCDLFLRGELS